jgi:hypothetical protein
VQGPAFSSQQQVFFVGSIQPTTEGFTAEFNSLADEGEKEFQMLLEKQGTWWQVGRKAKINATRRIQTIYNVYTRVTVFIVIRMRTCVGLHFELTTLQTLCVIELKIQILNIRLAAAAARTAHWLSRLLSPTTTTLRTKRAKVRAKVMEMRANKVITNNLCE